MAKIVTVFFTAVLLFLLQNIAFAQFSLVSTTPEDGAVNVATDTSLTLTFSAALDTSFRFEDFYLSIEIFPEDSSKSPTEVSLSQDLTTITASGFDFEEDTKYTVLLTGARSQSGEMLDHPYVLTFTTGSSFASGSVSGTVTYPGGDPDGTVVALFEDLFENDPVGLGLANGAFTIDYVPDGTYLLMGLKDTNQDGELSFEDGDVFGFYDQNGDGAPDSLVVDGDDTPGIDIELKELTRRTARGGLTAIETAVTTWAGDARLVDTFAEEIDHEGLATSWDYLFYSQNEEDFRVFFTIGDLIATFELDEEDAPDTTSLPLNWIDSDSAAQVVEDQGGSDFRDAFPGDIETFAALFVEHGGPENPPPLAGYDKRHVRKNFVGFTPDFGKRENKMKSATQQEALAVWYFQYHSWTFGKFFDLAVDAVTGEVLFSSSPQSAKDGLQAATDAARTWAQDVVLVNLGAYEIDEGGLAPEWAYAFYSPVKDSLFMSYSHGGGISVEIRPSFDAPSTQPLPENWLNSPEVATIAEQNSDDFRNKHSDVFVEAFLSHGIYHDDRAVWSFEYRVHNGPDGMKVVIDAVTGEFLPPPPRMEVVSTTPEHGAVNVPTLAQFEFTFSVPLDTIGGGEGGLLDIQFFPEGAVGEPAGIDFSSDLMTLNAHDVSLAEDTKIIGLLAGARGQNGGWMEKPFTFTFSTGANLPAGFVEGSIKQPPQGVGESLILLFGKDVLFGEVGGAAVSGGDYRVDYVEDGVYLPVAFGLHTMNPEIGFHDPDHDGQPDTVKVTSGGVTGIDIDFVPPPPQRARKSFDKITIAAQNWATDAILVGVMSDNMQPDGGASRWAYVFHSTQQGRFNAFISLGSFVMPVGFDDKLESPTALPVNWIDSDSAAFVAEMHGGRDFRDKNPGTFIYSLLSASEDKDGTIMPALKKNGIQLQKGKVWQPATEINQDATAVWYFSYTALVNDHVEFLDIFVDAVTGDVVTHVRQDEKPALPASFALEQNYPNPFNPETAIAYTVPKDTHVELNIFNLLGQRVRKLISQPQPAGAYKVTWDGRDDHGKLLPSGIYIYRLATAELTLTRRMILLK